MPALLAGCPRLGGCRPATPRGWDGGESRQTTRAARSIPIVASAALLIGLVRHARALTKSHTPPRSA